MKVDTFGSVNPRLHTDEILIALAMSAVTNPTAKLAMEQVPKLRDTDAHASVILSETDTRILTRHSSDDGADLRDGTVIPEILICMKKRGIVFCCF